MIILGTNKTQNYGNNLDKKGTKLEIRKEQRNEISHFMTTNVSKTYCSRYDF